MKYTKVEPIDLVLNYDGEDSSFKGTYSATNSLIKELSNQFPKSSIHGTVLVTEDPLENMCVPVMGVRLFSYKVPAKYLLGQLVEHKFSIQCTTRKFFKDGFVPSPF